MKSKFEENIPESNEVTKNKSATSSPVADEKICTLTFVKFFGEAWDHSATIFGKRADVSQDNYYSVYPKKEGVPSLGDPDDGIANMRIILFNAQQMLYTNIHFADPSELEKFPHEMVEVPVTKEQFDKAHHLAQQEKERAMQSKSKYSIFLTNKTYSCAGHQYRVLETIASPQEKPLLSSLSKVWPTKTFENAQKIASNRHNLLSEGKSQTTDLPDMVLHQRKIASGPGVSMFGLFGSLATSLLNAQNEKRQRIGLGMIPSK